MSGPLRQPSDAEPPSCKVLLQTVQEVYHTAPRHRTSRASRTRPGEVQLPDDEGGAKTVLPTEGAGCRRPTLREILQDMPLEGVPVPESGQAKQHSSEAQTGDLNAVDEVERVVDIVPDQPNAIYVCRADQLVSTQSLPDGKVRLVFRRGDHRPSEPALPSRPSSAATERPQSARTRSLFGDEIGAERPSVCGPSSRRPSRRPASARPSLGPFQEQAMGVGPNAARRRQNSVRYSQKPSRCRDRGGTSGAGQKRPSSAGAQGGQAPPHAEEGGTAGEATDLLPSSLVYDWLTMAQKCRARAKAACQPYWGERHREWIAATAGEPNLPNPSTPTAPKPSAPGVARPKRRSQCAARLYAALDQEAQVCSAGQTTVEDSLPLAPPCTPTRPSGQEEVAPAAPLRDEPQLGNAGAEAWQPLGEEDEGSKTARSSLRPSKRKSLVETREAIFWRLAHDGEVHRDSLCRALELCGIMSPVQAWVDDVFESMSKYTTLDLREFLRFSEAYEERQDREYAKAFERFDADASGTIEVCELCALLSSLGITPMDHVVAEILEEVDEDCSGKLDLEEFGRVMALLGVREGFAKEECDRLMAAFRSYDADGSGSLDVTELTSVLSYLHYSVSREDTFALAEEVDVDGSGNLNSREFLLFMRKVREMEISRLQAALRRVEQCKGGHSKETSLFYFLRALEYFPNRKAVLETAEDAGIQLTVNEHLAGMFRICVQKNSPSDKIGVTVQKSDVDNSNRLRVARVEEGLVRDWNETHADKQLLPGDDILEINGVKGAQQLLDVIATKTSLDFLVLRGQDKPAPEGGPRVDGPQPELGLSEAWRFLEVYRRREGLTRAEASSLQEVFQHFAGRSVSLDSGSLSTFTAGRALRWLGYEAPAQVEEQLLSQVDVNGSGRLGLEDFRKLVRKCHERELAEIRRTLQRLGLWREDVFVWITREQCEQALRATGCVDKDVKVAARRNGTDLLGLVSDVLRCRAEVRATFRVHSGFAPREVREMRTLFEKYDTNRGGDLRHAELRKLCEDTFPETTNDMRKRPELLALLSREAVGEDGVDFHAFLKLMREFTEIQKKDQRAKERHAVLASDFTAAQVREFRDVFIAADVEGRDRLSFKKVRQLIQRIAPLGDRRVDELTRVWQQVVGHSVKGNAWDADFADFLLLMKYLLDINFAGIKDWSAQAVQ